MPGPTGMIGKVPTGGGPSRPPTPGPSSGPSAPSNAAPPRPAAVPPPVAANRRPLNRDAVVELGNMVASPPHPPTSSRDEMLSDGRRMRVHTFEQGPIAELRSASWPRGSNPPEGFRDLHATFRPGDGRPEPWSMQGLQHWMRNMTGGGARPISDEVSGMRLTVATGRLPRHEIAFRNGDASIVDTLGRPYQREGGEEPRRSQGAPLSEPPPALHRADENVNPRRREDGSYGLSAPPPKDLTGGERPPQRGYWQTLRGAAGDMAASMRLGHAATAPQSHDPFADSFAPPSPPPTYREALRQPEFPLAALQASRERPPPPSYRHAFMTGDTAYYPPGRPRPPGPPISPEYRLFDPNPRPRQVPETGSAPPSPRPGPSSPQDPTS